jgi:hypothetical protein
MVISEITEADLSICFFWVKSLPPA